MLECPVAGEAAALCTDGWTWGLVAGEGPTCHFSLHSYRYLSLCAV